MAGLNISVVRCINNNGYEGMLDIGDVYQSLPTSATEDEAGDLRIVDNEGEDYLYKKSHFETVDAQELQSSFSFSATTHLNGLAGLFLRDMARAQGISISALLREWVDERLDLPAAL